MRGEKTVRILEASLWLLPRWRQGREVSLFVKSDVHCLGGPVIIFVVIFVESDIKKKQIVRR